MINKQKDTMITTTNPFSGESIDLTFYEHELYSAIKYYERFKRYEPMQKAIDKFSRLNTKAHRVLVD